MPNEQVPSVDTILATYNQAEITEYAKEWLDKAKHAVNNSLAFHTALELAKAGMQVGDIVEVDTSLPGHKPRFARYEILSKISVGGMPNVRLITQTRRDDSPPDIYDCLWHIVKEGKVVNRRT